MINFPPKQFTIFENKIFVGFLRKNVAGMI